MGHGRHRIHQKDSAPESAHLLRDHLTFSTILRTIKGKRKVTDQYLETNNLYFKKQSGADGIGNILDGNFGFFSCSLAI